jgi:tetratricopeptide (TPR) repeat protein
MSSFFPILQSLYSQTLLSSRKSIKIFSIYSDDKKDEEFRNRLETHLVALKRQKMITSYPSNSSQEVQKKIAFYCDRADIILLLISPSFQASEYCQLGVKQAMKQYQSKGTCIIPIVLRPVDNWQKEPFGQLKALPRDSKPVIKWRPYDDAFMDIAQSIREKVEELIEYRRKLYEYYKEFKNRAKFNAVLSSQDRLDLRELQTSLGVQNKDTQAIENKHLLKRKKIVSFTGIALGIIAGIFVISKLPSSYSSRLNAQEFFDRGRSLYEKGERKAAIESYTQAIITDPNNTIYYNSRGNAYLFEGDWKESAEDYTQTIKIDSKDAHAYRYRGEARFNLGDKQGALEDLKMSLYLYQIQGCENDYKNTLIFIQTYVIQ